MTPRRKSLSVSVSLAVYQIDLAGRATGISVDKAITVTFTKEVKEGPTRTARLGELRYEPERHLFLQPRRRPVAGHLQANTFRARRTKSTSRKPDPYGGAEGRAYGNGSLLVQHKSDKA